MHLAALIAIPYSYVAPAEYVYTNVVGTLNVLQACRDEGVEKIVHTSTSETYGTARYAPIDEEHPLQGQSPYSASKIGADKIAESFYLSFGTPVATLRPFNTYGPRQSARAVIPTIVSQLAAGPKQILLGSLDPVRDLTYAQDTAAAFMAVAESPRSAGQVVNAGTGEGISVGDLAKLIMEIMGVEAEVICDESRVRPKKSEVMELIANIDKIRDLTGWQPTVSLREGLARTAEYVRGHLDRYKPEIYNV
jgi:nucleoside-diphosphate-sugar epimerase